MLLGCDVIVAPSLLASYVRANTCMCVSWCVFEGGGVAETFRYMYDDTTVT